MGEENSGRQAAWPREWRDIIDNAYRLPFDQYQRYRLIAEVVPILVGDGPPEDVLEVGGYPPRLHLFLPDNRVTVLDAAHGRGPGYVRGLGPALPFPDKSFGVAASVDTLEHIAPGEREAFISELCRVASKGVILGAPFMTEAVRAADRAMFEFIREQSGYEQPFLKEHVEIELPDLVGSLVSMVDKGLDVQVLPSGRLDRWMFMMAAYYTIDADPDMKNTLPFLMEAYNRAYYDFDKAEPAYRHFLAGTYESLGRRWGKLADLASGESIDAAAVDSRSVAMVLELARTMAVKSKNAEIAALRAELAARDKEVAALREHNALLNDFAEKAKALPAYSAYEKILKPLLKK